MRDDPQYDYRQRLLVARELSGKTQAQAAKEAGMPLSTLAEAETKAKKPGYIARLARIYGVDPYWLETGEGESPAGLRGTSPTSSHAAAIMAESASSSDLEAALNVLVAAHARADALTAAQVAPLFSMLFAPSGKSEVNFGTIAQRIAELLVSQKNSSVGVVSSNSKTAAVRTSRLAGRKGQHDGSSGSAEGNRGQSDRDRGTRGHARKG